MMRIKSISRFAVLAVLALLIAVPGFAARGKADFTRFVALGDSYGAGVVSGSMNERHQPFSWPAVLARQLGTTEFAQPLVSFPGIGAELQIVDIVSYPPVIVPAPGSGQPLLLTYPKPYNNLSIPGATVNDLTTLTGGEQNPTSTAAQFARFILRGQGTAVQQALALHPTFIAVWIGGNDFLGAATQGSPKLLNSTEAFRTAYTKMLDQLIAGAPEAGIVVGNLPNNVSAVPYITTVPPVLVNPLTRQPVLLPNGQPIFFIADLGDGTTGQIPPGSAVLLPCSSQLATGLGLPEFLKADPRFASLPNIGKPLPDQCVLTPSETAQIVARINEFNQVISEAAAARNIPVADIKGLFDKFASPSGYPVGPFTFASSYITGGIFSLDGVHLTDAGYIFFANPYVRAINQAYGTEVPVASITQLFANNGAFFPENKMVSGGVFMEGMSWTISEEAERTILQLFQQSRRGKLRAVGH